MEKAAHHSFGLGITPFLALVLLFCGLRPGNLVKYDQNTKARPGAIFLADTIPEDFDKVLGTPRFTPYEPNPFAEEEDSRKVIPEVKIEVDTAYTQVQKIKKDYTGYKVEIANSEEPLPSSHDIFFQHGRLSMEMLQDSTYSYMLGDFPQRNEATTFMQDFLILRYPKARVIEYNEGQRFY